MKGIVITGDIAGFTSINPTKRELMIREMQVLMSSWVDKSGHAEIFRGDSFQLFFKDIGQALLRVIQLRCWLKKSFTIKQKTLLDARMSIGIGDISYLGNSILEADGEAFHLSGRAFDQMKDDNLLIITPDEQKNKELSIITMLMDIFISGWTAGQAEVIYLVIENKTQQQMADQLKIAQSAVNNRIKLSRWKEIDKTTNYLTSILKSV